ncbi:ASTRA-associated protein 1 [Zancudomyces culisetae]|uniref:ASTRA-associated protein 1 n=1 Tax=Zancudomyces culisetae TaxID=1213189 RepID=A0A1R1PX16_ZANCU|nr:ASTRA-associated protein 1 [Zancudomyces culisetae]|eukprot:OMH85536.1 ASTRA-associated protein 1 [Zancudomyces culisetae]
MCMALVLVNSAWGCVVFMGFDDGSVSYYVVNDIPDGSYRLVDGFLSSRDTTIGCTLTADSVGDFDSGRVSLKHNGVSSIDIDEDEETFAVGGWDFRAHIFGIRSLTHIGLINYHRGSVSCISFNKPHGASNAVLKIIENPDIEANTSISPLSPSHNAEYHMDNNKYLYSSSSPLRQCSQQEDQTTLKKNDTILCRTRNLPITRAYAVYSKKKWMAVGSHDSRLTLWELK